MNENKYNKLSWNDKNKLREYKIITDAKIIQDILNEKNFKPRNAWGGYTNGTLNIYVSTENGVIRSTANSLSYVRSIALSNSQTNYNLGYKGYSTFGDYIVDTYLTRYATFNDRCELVKINSNGYTDPEWEEFFKKEFIACIDETTIRVTKKQKTKAIKDRLQNIENDVDCAILGFVEENAERGLTITTDKSPSQAVSISWTIKKYLENYGGFHGPCMTIRKNINGTYSLTYMKISSYNNYFTLWQKLKKDITGEEMAAMLHEYFDEFLKLPSTLNLSTEIITKLTA